MKNLMTGKMTIITAFIAVTMMTSCGRMDEEQYYAEGVSKLLAVYRNATIEEVSYRLSFDIPCSADSAIFCTETVEFSLMSKREPVVLDFRSPDNQLSDVKVNGKVVVPLIHNGHIIINEKYLRKGYNRIQMSFRAGDMSLNRNSDFLYTLFVPDRASTAFPCFDQPDIKAVFNLALEIPFDWEAISNAPVISSDSLYGRKRLSFGKTRNISTYLFAFAAGKFDRIVKEVEGMQIEMLHREDRSEYITGNSEAIFMLHYNAIKWLEEYTGIKYPFDKVGFILIPSFQYSGMEHPGSVYYRASSLLLESSPTLNEQLSRASLIAHETAHLWFGDLVTMKWFDDVWLKEVFAGFMADKIVNPDFPGIDHDLRFLLSRYPAAYAVDRTSGSNPIIQELANMKDAGSLYGGIIYNKAPVVMRHLEVKAGSENLQAGLQTYLSRYSYANATWDDLIAILEEQTAKPLEEWSRIWVREAGMPVITTITEKQEQGFTVSFREDDPKDILRRWDQKMTSMVITADDTIITGTTPGDRSSVITTATEPLCIVPDISAMAYGTFILDSATVAWVENQIMDFDPLIRAVIWINLNENHINGRIGSGRYFAMLLRALEEEDDRQVRDYLINRLRSVFWDHLTPALQGEYGPAAEELSWNSMLASSDASEKRTWFNMFRSIAMSNHAIGDLKTIWEKGSLPGGPGLSIDELTTLAFSLALRETGEAEEILSEQRQRITNHDKLQQFDFITPSLSDDQEVRDEFFESLLDPANREHEPWVTEALAYLHHPLRSEHSVKYVLPSLEELEEIRATGDIFFPGGWLSATLSGHHSAEARDIVLRFLEDHSDYPSDLRLKILQSADHLLRIKGDTAGVKNTL